MASERCTIYCVLKVIGGTITRIPSVCVMGLNIGRKRKRGLPARVKTPHIIPIQSNITWSADFMQDSLNNGRPFSTFNVIDDHTREALMITIDTSLSARSLSDLKAQQKLITLGMISFIGVAREQVSFMPYDLNEWLPEDLLARFVVNIASKMDLRRVYSSYSGKGSTPYDPKLLLSLIFKAIRQVFLVP